MKDFPLHVNLDHISHDVPAAAQPRGRQITENDMSRFEGYLAEIFTALGMDFGHSRH